MHCPLAPAHASVRAALPPRFQLDALSCNVHAIATEPPFRYHTFYACSASLSLNVPLDLVRFWSRQGEDFHRMLTIARLTALSLGDATMTAEHWSHMKNLEASVSGRIQQEQATRATNGSSSAVVVPAAANSAVGATPIPPSSQAGPLNAIPEND